MNDTTIENIPKEIMGLVFRFFSVRDLRQTALVNKKFNNLQIQALEQIFSPFAKKIELFINQTTSKNLNDLKNFSQGLSDCIKDMMIGENSKNLPLYVKYFLRKFKKTNSDINTRIEGSYYSLGFIFCNTWQNMKVMKVLVEEGLNTNLKQGNGSSINKTIFSESNFEAPNSIEKIALVLTHSKFLIDFETDLLSTLANQIASYVDPAFNLVSENTRKLYIKVWAIVYSYLNKDQKKEFETFYHRTLDCNQYYAQNSISSTDKRREELQQLIDSTFKEYCDQYTPIFNEAKAKITNQSSQKTLSL